MAETTHRAIAVVGVSAIMPDAPDAKAFWDNINNSKYSITEVPPDRWDADAYFDTDRKARDKSYTKIGGWVRDFEWDPIKWRLPIPPRVQDAMDIGQQWAVACTRSLLLDYGYPERPLDTERTGIIVGNAMGGERHYVTALRISQPEYIRLLNETGAFAELPESTREAIIRAFREHAANAFPPVTEDSMPGELSNCIAGRIANVFGFRGPNYTCDAACASAMAAITAAAGGLVEGDYDAVITGGIDRNMGASTFVKFCKIGALSASGSRPYAEGADGFVMGEGAALLLLKRLADAERDGDTIYAVIRGIGASSDGKGKGITAPNPVGQRLAVMRAWENAGLTPNEGILIEGHGTSTAVGDAAELQSMQDVFGNAVPTRHSIALGSVKSNIGHLKGGAGAAGLFKASLALRHKVLPPSIKFHAPNPGFDFEHSPFYVNTELQDWKLPPGNPRRAGVSAFGFGGTNFHVVMEEHVPGLLTSQSRGRTSVAVPGAGSAPVAQTKGPPRGALVLGAADEAGLLAQLKQVQADAAAGHAPPPAPPSQAALRAAERLSIDYADAEELATKASRAIKVLENQNASGWKALRARGIFRGSGAPAKIAFLYTGQGSQYVNMLRELRATEPIVREVFDEADRIMAKHIDRQLSSVIFVDANDEAAVKESEEALMQTAITQPAVLTVDHALTKLLAVYGVRPDMVMGHSLGEYGALVAAGSLPFEDALEAVSARGREMTRVSVADNGKMAAVFAPIEDIQRALESVKGYAVLANLNSSRQAVVGGSSEGVDEASRVLTDAGFNVIQLPVSHAFHTKIVAQAIEPLREVLSRLRLTTPTTPIVANVTGEFYSMDPSSRDEMLDILGRQVAATVQFVKGLNTLYEAGARVFVEVGPKRALQGFAEDVLGEREGVMTMCMNHPKFGDLVSVNRALCALYACGHGMGTSTADTAEIPAGSAVSAPATAVAAAAPPPAPVAPLPTAAAAPAPVAMAPASPSGQDTYLQLGKLFAEFFDRGRQIYERSSAPPTPARVPVCVTGVGLGLPGVERVFDDRNLERFLSGEVFIQPIPDGLREKMARKRIHRLVKSSSGEAEFAIIDQVDGVVKLAGRAGAFDLGAEFGVAAERIPALDHLTQLAIAVGLEALRDAGIPLVMRYRKTSTGSFLPAGWALPEAMRDNTGIVFASAFPSSETFAKDLKDYYESEARRQRLTELEELRSQTTDTALQAKLDGRIAGLREEVENNTFEFDRRFLFRILAMGHSQFAELIGARGPNTHINSACASTTQSFSIAEDWLNSGRCSRVIVVSADDVSSDTLMEWFGAGFLATGAAATGDVVEEVATPFDRRRNGMVIGMGAAAIIFERAEAARERAIQPICEVLSAVTANSAFHGTRLDVEHITGVMEMLVKQAEARWGVSRAEFAPKTVFVSHETYTPARGGSAQAEVFALRRVFGAAADQIVIANTKGYTGHAMGAGVEDVLAVRALETGVVPPVPNFKEVDPDLGNLNLSRGGYQPMEYALRLGAGFGSQISLTLMRRTAQGPRPQPNAVGFHNRVTDPARWQSYLAELCGHDSAELEIAHRTLRIKDQGPPKRALAAAPPPAYAEALRTPVAAASAPAPTSFEPPTVPAVLPPSQPPPPQAEPFDLPPEQLRGGLPPSVPPPPPPTPGGEDPVQERVLALVAEKTGYPADMLALDLDLEADLGIDTVKQAEVFAAIREAYDIPRDDSIKLRDYPTLKHVVGFVRDKAPGLPAAPTTVGSTPNPAPPPAATGSTPEPPASGGDSVEQRVLALVAEKTGYPQDMLALDLDLEADLGVDTVKQAEVFASIRDAYDIPRDDSIKLRDYPTLKHVIGFVRERAPGLPAPAAAPAKPAPAPPASAASPAAEPGGADEVIARVLALVAEKTGYPEDMLDLDLDLEADLGVDTVKQAEVFATIREAYDIPRDDALKLRDYPTLAHVIQFVRDKAPGLPAPAVAPPVASPPAGAEAPATAASSEDEITGRVLALVAEKTGYPEDMLDLDLDLEADLGVDTVKQAEVFAAIREAYDIARDDALKLRDYRTLAHVIQFVRDRLPAGGGDLPAVEPEPSQPEAAPPSGTEQFPRRVPVPCLRPAVSACKSTGIELAKGKRVLVMPDQGGVATALGKALRQRGVEVLTFKKPPKREKLPERIAEWLSKGPIDGVYWLPALDREAPIEKLDLKGWRSALEVRVKLLYETLRALYEPLARPDAFVVSATRLGGLQGYDSAGAVAPLGGAVCGCTKAFKRERLDTLVKSVDFEADAEVDQIVARLLDETLRDRGLIEVGYRENLRWTVGLQETSAADGGAGMDLSAKSVFVVTGAAGSIVSAITADLAAASGGTFHLLDLVPAPNESDPDLARFATDKDGLKREIFERIKQSGQRATPIMVEKQLATLERAHAALTAIRAIRAAGGTAVYHSVDLRDTKAVGRAINAVRKDSGRIDVLLHAAGLEISRTLPDKSATEYDLVFDVKCDGWFNLLSAIGDLPLGAAVVFSSIAGRFGNSGQADYSAANDLLCKSISSFRTTRPDTRGVAIDWTAWASIGMASRGSIPQIMAAAGVDMLPPEIGIPVIRRELCAGSFRGEVVVAGALGMMVEEFDETGGLDPAAFTEIQAGPMVGRVTAAHLYGGLSVETRLDPKQQAFLYDHQIDGTPVLPGVMGVEAFAEIAKLLLPDWNVISIENVEFAAPFKFFRSEPRTLNLSATLRHDGETVVADCRLTGSRTLPGHDQPQVTTHFTAGVRLAASQPTVETTAVPGTDAKADVEAGSIYNIYFHGPAYQVLERAWRDNGSAAALLSDKLPPNHEPADLATVAAPRLLESCFQAAGVWEIGTSGRMGLPHRVDRLVALRDPTAANDRRLYAIAKPNGDGYDAMVVDSEGTVYVQLFGYRTIQLPTPVDAQLLEPIERAMRDR